MDGHSVLDVRRRSIFLSAPEYAGRAAVGRPWGVKLVARWCSCTRTNPPPLPGVYAIFRQGRLQYIGSTDQLARRLRHHRARGQDTSDAKFSVETRPGEWLAREYRLLARLRPPGNTRLPKHRR